MYGLCLTIIVHILNQNSSTEKTRSNNPSPPHRSGGNDEQQPATSQGGGNGTAREAAASTTASKQRRSARNTSATSKSIKKSSGDSVSSDNESASSKRLSGNRRSRRKCGLPPDTPADDRKSPPELLSATANLPTIAEELPVIPNRPKVIENPVSKLNHDATSHSSDGSTVVVNNTSATKGSANGDKSAAVNNETVDTSRAQPPNSNAVKSNTADTNVIRINKSNAGQPTGEGSADNARPIVPVLPPFQSEHLAVGVASASASGNNASGADSETELRNITSATAPSGDETGKLLHISCPLYIACVWFSFRAGHISIVLLDNIIRPFCVTWFIEYLRVINCSCVLSCVCCAICGLSRMPGVLRQLKTLTFGVVYFLLHTLSECPSKSSFYAFA